MKSFKWGLVVTCFLFFFAIDAVAFSTHDTSVTRNFSEEEAAVGSAITVSVVFTHDEADTLRGFYCADHIPEGLSVHTVSVRIDGGNVSNYRVQSDPVGDVYPGYATCLWILETPNGFPENNPVSPGSTVEIVYAVSSSGEGTFHFDDFDWVGYYPKPRPAAEAAFGHSEENDRATITFTADGQVGGGPTAGGSGGGGGGRCFLTTAAGRPLVESSLKGLNGLLEKLLLTSNTSRDFVILAKSHK